MKLNRVLSVLLLLSLLVTVAGCGKKQAEEVTEEPITLSLYVYSTGKWDNETAVDALLHDFYTSNPYVTVEVTYLQEETADRDIRISIESGECPDLLFGSLSQLHHAQRCAGTAIDLSDLCKSTIYPAVRDACMDSTGLFYALPSVMDITCMAINYEMFQDADALQYIDEVHHTWTTENFQKAVKALKVLDQSPDVLALYCGGQNGDAGTRALVTNLYGGTFTDDAHTRYTLNMEENITALTTLQKQRGVLFDADIVGDDEQLLFAQEQLAISLCWHSDAEQPEKFTAFPMAYPTPEGETAKLPGEVWGFSCFDNDDVRKVEAGKALLSYLTGKDAVYGKLASLCGHYSVRKLNSAESNIYTAFMPMMGSYDLYTPGFAVARTEWYELLQRLGMGADVALEVDTFCTNANAAARDMK